MCLIFPVASTFLDLINSATILLGHLYSQLPSTYKQHVYIQRVIHTVHTYIHMYIYPT
uniref:Uncharacterized protein n=1 Tax=Pyxicephalus adspersus TaxID=30357 RepID=A0AAV2ZZA6_PYXAD|nr:TPA: hypothetical protein GDO54_013237 [Pyxicephalus adspersus]